MLLPASFWPVAREKKGLGHCCCCCCCCWQQQRTSAWMEAAAGGTASDGGWRAAAAAAAAATAPTCEAAIWALLPCRIKNHFSLIFIIDFFKKQNEHLLLLLSALRTRLDARGKEEEGGSRMALVWSAGRPREEKEGAQVYTFVTLPPSLWKMPPPPCRSDALFHKKLHE